MFLPVERSIRVSPPHLTDQRIFSTSSSIEEATAELPMFVLILTRKFRPITIGSSSAWLMFAGMIARPRATSSRTNSGVISAGIAAPKERPGCWRQSELRGPAAVSSIRSADRWSFVFSRTATYSISGVTIPLRAYASWETREPGFARRTLRALPSKNLIGFRRPSLSAFSRCWSER